MQVYPFDGYLNYFPSSYGELEVTREQLKEFSFPIDPALLENKGNGLIPRQHNGQDFFNVRELIGYARMYSLPNEGFISRKPIRHAEILELETYIDEKTGNLKIKHVHIAAAFMPPENRQRGSGQMVFICPFCGCIHYHGASGEVFGDGDGERIPHCLCDIPAFYRQDRQSIGKNLDRNWKFDLVETEDFRRAGDFPKYFAKYLVNRRKG